MRNKIFVLMLFIVLSVSSSAWSEVYAEGEALAVFKVPEGSSVSAASVNVAESVGEIGASVAETYSSTP